MDGSYAEQPIFYSPMWGNGNMPLPAAAQEMQRLQHLPPQFIIEEYVAARMKFEEERNAMMKHIGDLQHEKRMQVRMQLFRVVNSTLANVCLHPGNVCHSYILGVMSNAVDNACGT